MQRRSLATWRVYKKCVCSLYSTNTLTITDSIYIHLSRRIILTVWDSEWWMLGGDVPRAPHPHTFPSFLLLFLPTHTLQKCAARTMHFAAKNSVLLYLSNLWSTDIKSIASVIVLLFTLNNSFGKVKPLVSRGHSQMTSQHWTTNGNLKSWRKLTRRDQGSSEIWWMMKNPKIWGNPSKKGLSGSH